MCAAPRAGSTHSRATSHVNPRAERFTGMGRRPRLRRPRGSRSPATGSAARIPRAALATGDFDGDGRQDLFLATGAAWYYAPAGLAEWRYLKADRAERGDLLFGDVDGDGRTDVVIKQGSVWLVSWAGASERERINERDGAISDFALGDFNGDGRADLFHTNGSQWLISYGSTTPFHGAGIPITIPARRSSPW